MTKFKTIDDITNGTVIKLVPEQTKGGVLDPRAREELLAGQRNINEPAPIIPPDITSLRAMMGWPNAIDIATHPLTVVDTATAYGVKVRTYVKTTLVDEILPVIFFYHGGGFFGGSLNNVDKPARALADLADVLVVSVDWSLAPEHPYPEGFLEAYQTIIWVLNQSGWPIDKRKVSVLGDSAGGGFAYGLGLLDREFGLNVITKLIAFYPVTYQAHDVTFEKLFNDVRRYPVSIADRDLLLPYFNGFFGSSGLIDQLYIQNSDPDSVYISPFLADDKLLAQLPESLTIIDEYDPLRFQGEAFIQKVRLNGGQANYVRYNGMTHAFMDKVGDFAQAEDALREAATFAVK
ncbi:alpha/beta hydrolase fold domain-containing protein [Leuconostoc aquikimchii]|uniref:Alpha/beta hydrolase fold domain-containing protein n=1 Tax=Leuconostoc aquikimchii TaxID=3236804 RepID=A0ABV3S0M0_9LACO